MAKRQREVTQEEIEEAMRALRAMPKGNPNAWRNAARSARKRKHMRRVWREADKAAAEEERRRVAGRRLNRWSNLSEAEAVREVRTRCKAIVEDMNLRGAYRAFVEETHISNTPQHTVEVLERFVESFGVPKRGDWSNIPLELRKLMHPLFCRLYRARGYPFKFQSLVDYYGAKGISQRDYFNNAVWKRYAEMMGMGLPGIYDFSDDTVYDINAEDAITKIEEFIYCRLFGLYAFPLNAAPESHAKWYRAAHHIFSIKGRHTPASITRNLQRLAQCVLAMNNVEGLSL